MSKSAKRMLNQGKPRVIYYITEFDCPTHRDKFGFSAAFWQILKKIVWLELEIQISQDLPCRNLCNSSSHTISL